MISLTSHVDAEFDRVPGYCNTATVGIPARRTLTRLRACVDQWEAGTLQPAGFDHDVLRSRTAFGQLVGVPVSSVALTGAVSISVGVVASCLSDGSTVLCAEEDFTSVLYPFLTDNRLNVVTVPLDQIVDRVADDIDLVAVSAVQSSDGRVLNLDHLRSAADQHGCRTLVDVTQAAGWLPVDLSRFDVGVCGAYKWLACPRGIGFMTVAPHVDWLTPRLAGWYASAEPWDSCYGPPLRLAPDAHRFGVSPAWFDVAATAEALEVLVAAGVERVHKHNVGLTNRLLAGLSLPASNSAIVSLDTSPTQVEQLTTTGIVSANRAGRTRLSFHLTNTDTDVDTALDALAG